jgi:hypothetical protein
LRIFVVGGFQIKRCICWIVLCLLCAVRAWAVPTVDGNASPSDGYGAALSVQNTNTQFGDSTYGDPVNASGSEIDQVFGTVQNGHLYVTVSGNLEPNFNKLVVFMDSKVGGVHTIDGTALPAGVDAYCCGGPGSGSGALQRLNGLTFDAGFNADYMLAFTSGQESVNANMPNQSSFWTLSAHYADLTQGKNGAVVDAGMQLAPRGLPKVLRSPGDFNQDGGVDRGDYVLWSHTLGQSVLPNGTGADANGNGVVDQADYNIWKANFGNSVTLADQPRVPSDSFHGETNGLVGPTLPGLAQGQLIDRNYAITSGGCNANNSGAGCVAPELAFALGVDPSDPSNTKNHRNFNNSIDLQMAVDNSNKVGVTGAGPYDTPTTGNPQIVTSGLEFSIPLSQIGTTAGAGPIKLTAFFTGGDYAYISNQFAGDGLLFGNVGQSPFPSLADDFPGNQYVTVANPGPGAGASGVSVPEPSAIGLLLSCAPAVLAIGGLLRR